MTLFHNKYRAETIRKKGWDYARGGKYFITICTKNHICCFGDVLDGKMILNELGLIADLFWREIPQHFENIWLDQFIVMPDHIHGIIGIKRLKNEIETNNVDDDKHDDKHDGKHTTNQKNFIKNEIMSKISPKPGSIHAIIRSFKSACTKKYNELGLQWIGWQARYYDEIIANTNRLNQIRNYIIDNPANYGKKIINFKQSIFYFPHLPQFCIFYKIGMRRNNAYYKSIISI